MVLLILLIVCIVRSQPIDNACEEEKYQRRFMHCDGNQNIIQGDVLPRDPNWPSSPPSPYVISPELLRFDALPRGGQFQPHTNVTLQCSVKCTSTDCKVCPVIYWSLSNGTNVSTLGKDFIVTQKSLTVHNFNKAKEGSYICHAQDGDYSFSTYPVDLQLPKFTQWSNAVYNIPRVIEERHYVYITVPPHGAAVLECGVEGNSPPARVDWSGAPDNNGTVQLPNGNLLVRDFSRHNPPILCTNFIEEGNNTHYLLFTVTVEEENDEQGAPVLLATPRSQEVPIGANVTLYCLAHSSISVEYQWYHGNTLLATPITPQVLLVNDISQTGSYTCVGWNQYGNVTATAVITAIDVPSPVISLVNSSIPYEISNNDIVLTDPPTRERINMTFNCTVPGHVHYPTEYRWVYKGRDLTETSSQLVLSENNLDEIVGSVQCLATPPVGVAGIGYLRIVKDKCNPPCSVYSNPSDATPTFTLSWTPPTHDIGYTYQVEVADGPNKKMTHVYRANTSQTCITANMKVETYDNDCVLRLGGQVRVRAVTGEGKSSDYVYLETIRPIQCNLPSSLTLTNMHSVITGFNGGLWTVKLYFDTLSVSYVNTPGYQYNQCDDEMYNGGYTFSSCCVTNEEEQCTLQRMGDKGSWINSPVFLHVPCHSRCYWKAGLGVQRGDEISWTSVYVFDTEEVGPLVGGNVTNVTWSDDTGTQLQVIVKLPPINESCISTKDVTIDLYLTCGDNVTILGAHTAPAEFDISLSAASCWDTSCHLYATYNNSVGRSPLSNTVTLPRPSIGNIGGYNDMTYTPLTNNTAGIHINWTLARGMECLLNKGYISHIEFSVSTPAGSNSDCTAITHWSHTHVLTNRTTNELYLLSEGLEGKEVCVQVAFTLRSGDVATHHYLLIPPHFTATDPSSTAATPSSSDLISTKLFINTTLPIVCVVIILVICAVLAIALMYKRMKKQRNNNTDDSNRELLQTIDGSDDYKLKDDETVITKCETLEPIELEPGKQQRIDSYLKDLEEHPQCYDNEGEVGVARTIKAEVYEATPPSVSLLKGQDCETVQNASQSLYKVLEATDWSEYQSYRPHPPDVTELNDMSSSYSGGYERHELIQLNDNEPLATPTPPISGCHSDRPHPYPVHSFDDEYLMVDINSHRGYTHSVGGASLPWGLDEYMCQDESPSQRDVLTTPSQLATPSILPLSLATPTSHAPSVQKSLQRRHSETRQEKGLSHQLKPRPSLQYFSEPPHPYQIHRNSVGHMTTSAGLTTSAGHMTTGTGHMTTGTGHMTTGTGHMTTGTGHMTTGTGHMTTSAGHMTTGTGHMTTGTGHMTTGTGHMTTSAGHMTTGTGHMTTGSDYLPHKGAYPSHPARSPSRISSGISSPKSTGSFESVFESDPHTSPRSHSIVGVATRHHSDATSGIGSPSHISPLGVNGNRFTFNTHLSSLSHAPNVLDCYNLPLQGVPHPPIRRRSHDIASNGYIQSSDVIARLSVSETPPLSPLTPLLPPLPFLTTPTPLTALTPLPPPLSLPTSTVSRAPSILTPPPFRSPPSTFTSQSTSNAPCIINPLVTKHSSYILPSLLSHVNNTTPTTATPTIPPPTSAMINPTCDGYERLSPSPSSDGYSDSYSICSNTSSMEEFKMEGNMGTVQHNDYLIDESCFSDTR